VRHLTVTSSKRHTCSLITPESQVVRVDLDNVFGASSTMTVTRRQGESLPLDSFSAPASHYAMVISDPGGGPSETFVLGGFAHHDMSGRRVKLRFRVTNEHEFLTITRVDETPEGPLTTIMGSGPCLEREGAQG